mgnify:FL=1
MSDKEDIFLRLSNTIDTKEAQLKNLKEELDEKRTKINSIEIEMEKISKENQKMHEESKHYESKYFELQAKVIDAQIEVAKVKKEQIGPIAKKR